MNVISADDLVSPIALRALPQITINIMTGTARYQTIMYSLIKGTTSSLAPKARNKGLKGRKTDDSYSQRDDDHQEGTVGNHARRFVVAVFPDQP